MSDTAITATRSDSDPRPVVRTAAPSNLGLWVFAGLLLLGGAWIVSLMSTAREAAEAPRTTIPAAAGQAPIASAAPPPLPPRFETDYLPASRRYLSPVAVVPEARPIIPNATPPFPVAQPRARVVASPSPIPPYTPPPVEYREPLPQNVERVEPPARAGSAAADDTTGGERVMARRLYNPSLTVPLGTLIPAVLETALDSTRPGSVRALVQRDVRSFDGSRVLIPRGSRLYGGYEGTLAEGQNRALVTWSRLLRPDGVMIALDSQASDPLGRAGIRGKVDSKFLQRFGGAVLQTILDIGIGRALRAASGGVVVALPGAAQSVTQVVPSQITPTLTVRQGTSVSVYVGRDLDFSSVE